MALTVDTHSVDRAPGFKATVDIGDLPADVLQQAVKAGATAQGLEGTRKAARAELEKRGLLERADPDAGKNLPNDRLTVAGKDKDAKGPDDKGPDPALDGVKKQVVAYRDNLETRLLDATDGKVNVSSLPLNQLADAVNAAENIPPCKDCAVTELGNLAKAAETMGIQQDKEQVLGA